MKTIAKNTEGKNIKFRRSEDLRCKYDENWMASSLDKIVEIKVDSLEFIQGEKSLDTFRKNDHVILIEKDTMRVSILDANQVVEII